MFDTLLQNTEKVNFVSRRLEAMVKHEAGVSYGFSNSITFPGEINNENVGCCLKILIWASVRAFISCERWQRLLKKSPKAVFVAQKLQNASRTFEKYLFLLRSPNSEIEAHACALSNR